MARPLPFTAITDTAEKYDITFPLHPSTEAPMRVHQLLGDLLEAVSREVRRDNMSNGDVLQAMAMALAVRARMIASDPETTTALARDLLDAAIEGVLDAEVTTPPIGRA